MMNTEARPPLRSVASRIVGGSGESAFLAERYLYFPSAGLAVCLAFGLRFLALRFGFLMTTVPVILVLLVLAPLTWNRNAEWADEILLFESDYRRGSRSINLLRVLSGSHLLQWNFPRVVELCDDHPRARKQSGNFSAHCATAYSQVGRIEEAERAYIHATRKRHSRTVGHANLARFYLRQGRRAEAKEHFELAVSTEEEPANRAYRKGFLITQLYPGDRAMLVKAKNHFEEALALQPHHKKARKWLARVNQELNRTDLQ